MKGILHRTGSVIALLALGAPGAPPIPAQDAGQIPSTSAAQNPQRGTPISSTPQGGFTLRANAELVLTNVVARDAKTGELITGLKQSDFKIYENGKEQQIDSFDFESVDMAIATQRGHCERACCRPQRHRRLSSSPSPKSCATTG